MTYSIKVIGVPMRSAARNAYHWVGSITPPIEATVLFEKPKHTICLCTGAQYWLFTAAVVRA